MLMKTDMAKFTTMSAERLASGLGCSIATVKRDISQLRNAEYAVSTGAGRGGGYFLSVKGRLFVPLDAEKHCADDPDKRYVRERFDSDMFPDFPDRLFTEAEETELRPSAKPFASPVVIPTDEGETIAAARKELERFVIELAWKSSSLEGNTYSLLDTERLIRHGEETGHSKEETTMILNHKHAFMFTLQNLAMFAGRPNTAALQDLHAKLVGGLGVRSGFRTGRVGITGTRYRPPHDVGRIAHAVDDILDAVGRATDPHSGALTALAGLSYIQAFEDGNKRTARLAANAVLLARGQYPLSYRSTSYTDYNKAILTFYETGSIAPLKDMFIRMCEFSKDHYSFPSTTHYVGKGLGIEDAPDMKADDLCSGPPESGGRMESAEELFKRMRSTTLSRFFGSGDKAGVEVFTKGVMKPLYGPELLGRARSKFRDGTDIAGKKITISSKEHPEEVITLLAVLLAYEDILKESDCEEVVITVPGNPPKRRTSNTPKSYTKTGEVVFYRTGKGVLFIFLSSEGKLLKRSRDSKIVDYVSTVLHEIAHSKTLLASRWELGQLYGALLEIRPLLMHATPAWRVLDMSAGIAEASAKLINPKDYGLFVNQEMAADAWLVSTVLNEPKATGGIWGEYRRLYRSAVKEFTTPGALNLDAKLGAVVISHADNMKLCEKGKPPPDIFVDGVVSSATFEIEH